MISLRSEISVPLLKPGAYSTNKGIVLREFEGYYLDVGRAGCGLGVGCRYRIVPVLPGFGYPLMSWVQES